MRFCTLMTCLGKNAAALLLAGFRTHAKQGQIQAALELLPQLEKQGLQPDHLTLASILKACATCKNLEIGKRIHAHMLHVGAMPDMFLENSLISMYAKCGGVDSSRDVFDKMCERNVVSWTVMINTYANFGNPQEALRLFRQMEQEGETPNNFTYVSVLNACASLTDIERGKQIHSNVRSRDIKMDSVIASTLINLYMKCGKIRDARQIFLELHERDAVLWNAIIAGYIQHGDCKEALRLSQQMEKEGFQPDQYTYVCLLKACTSSAELKQMHDRIQSSCIDMNSFIANTLLHMYVRYGNIEEARQIFDKMCMRNVVSWTAMIFGYVQHSYNLKALRLFKQMKRANVEPNEFTFTSVLGACAGLAALDQGISIHAQMVKSKIKLNTHLQSALIDMYAKCGRLKEAQQVLDQSQEKNIVAFTAMMSGYAWQGDGIGALTLVKKMIEEGVNMNSITLVGVLSACSLAGLMDEGHSVFKFMERDLGIKPKAEHYACIVLLFGLAGRLQEVLGVVVGMPTEPDNNVWRALLNLVKIYEAVGLADNLPEVVGNLGLTETGSFPLLPVSNIVDRKYKVLEVITNRGFL